MSEAGPGGFDLTGRVALVTGARRGIGRALAVGLARAGADVVVLDRERDTALDEVADAIRAVGRQAWPWAQDLAQLDELADTVDQIRSTTGRLDILVNNAGVASIERFNALTLQTWRQTMTVNLDAPFVLSQRFAEHLIADGIPGRIVNVTSKNAFVGEAGLVHYDTAKAGLAMLTRTLAVELGEFGITVNSIAPGMVDTGIVAHFHADREAFQAYYRRHIPLQGRYATPEECVGPLLLLASDAGSYITGQHIVVDGGVLAQQVPRTQFLPPYESTLEQR
jgi:2-dehydro-3-deoxy-D-gluconate 5-dehydrogenase